MIIRFWPTHARRHHFNFVSVRFGCTLCTGGGARPLPAIMTTSWADQAASAVSRSLQADWCGWILSRTKPDSMSSTPLLFGAFSSLKEKPRETYHEILRLLQQSKISELLRMVDVPGDSRAFARKGDCVSLCGQDIPIAWASCGTQDHDSDIRLVVMIPCTESSYPQLLALLRIAARGVLDRVVRAGVLKHDAAFKPITSREHEVAFRIIEGHSIRKIGELLGVSSHTVHDHVKSLHKKLLVTNRAQLVAKFLGRSS